MGSAVRVAETDERNDPSPFSKKKHRTNSKINLKIHHGQICEIKFNLSYQIFTPTFNFGFNLEHLQETLYIFYRNRKFGKKKYSPTGSSIGYLNINIPYFGFLARQR